MNAKKYDEIHKYFFRITFLVLNMTFFINAIPKAGHGNGLNSLNTHFSFKENIFNRGAKV